MSTLSPNNPATVRVLVSKRGTQGPVGDVTPEATAAANTSVNAAQMAEQAAAQATTAKSDAAAAATAAQLARDSAQVDAGQAAADATRAESAADTAAGAADITVSARDQTFAAVTGERYGVATRADLNALSGVAIGEVRAVTNDPTSTNNGAWRKTGAGASDWTQAADRVTGLEGVVATKADSADLYAMTKYASVGSFTVNNFYVRVNNGGLVGNPNYEATDFIDVVGGLSYLAGAGIDSGVSGHAWYDENRAFISGFKTGTNDTPVLVVAPSNASYIRMSRRRDLSPEPSLRAYRHSLSVGSIRDQLSVLNPTIHPRSIPVGAGDLAEYISANDAAVETALTEATLTVARADDLKTLNFGISEAAWPEGRRVYCKETRCEVTADGAFWRMPDGRSVAEADLVFSAPQWDEAFDRLADYAVDHHLLTNVADRSGWSERGGSLSPWFRFDDRWGFNAVHVWAEADASPYHTVEYMNLTEVGVNHWVVFKTASNDYSRTNSFVINLLSSDGVELFNRRASFTGSTHFRGQDQRPLYTSGVERWEIPVSAFVASIPGARLEDVAGVGIRLERSAVPRADMWFGDIHTVNFRPMITLRFDDQWATQHSHAFPALEAKGFKGLMAIITGAKALADDPKLAFEIPAMSKTEIEEMRDAGWDIVCHTHTHRHQPSLTEDEIDWDLQTCKKYLTEQLGASLLQRSCIIFPQNAVDERCMRIARRYFDICIRKTRSNSAMPRQPEGNWDRGSLWMAAGSREGDGKSGAQLIDIAQQAIDNQYWQTVMFHRIDPSSATGGLNVHPDDFQQLVDFLDANRDKIDVVTLTDVVNRIRGP